MSKIPIYVRQGSMREPQIKKLEEATGRPVILTLGPPDTEILDCAETLRDKFAGQALTGMTANSAYIKYVHDKELDSAGQLCSKLAYIIADAMLKEREK